MNTFSKCAVVLVSGGLDSATTLAIARERGFTCHALSIDYGQRHRAELDAARLVALKHGAVEHRVVRVDLSGWGGSALTDANIRVPTEAGEGIPITYVPARNTIMLSIALGWAEVLKADAMFCGANAVDYSGYPDCRPEYFAAFQRLATLATKIGIEGSGIAIETPIIGLSKGGIIAEGQRLGVDFAATVSCYQADEQGRACGQCDACRLRKEGFREAGMQDPTRYAPHSRL